MWMLGGTLLGLHYISPKFGFTPFIIVLGGLTMLLQSQIQVYVEPIQGLFLLIGSNVIVPVILGVVLVLYIANGAVMARVTIYGTLAVTILSLVALYYYRIHLLFPSAGILNAERLDSVVTAPDPRGAFASITAFAIDLLVINIFYQGARNRYPRVPEWLIIGASLFASLWADAIVFWLIYAFGNPLFVNLLSGDILGKTVSGLLMWPLLAVYLVLIAPNMPDYIGGNSRPTFDLFLGSLRDIKLALIRSEQALARSQQERRQETAYQRQIADSISDGLWLSSFDNTQTFYVNPAYERIWGRSAASLLATPLTFLESIYTEDRARVLASIQEQASGEHDLRYRIVRPDGAIRWVHDRTIPIRDEQGRVYRIAGITNDITEEMEVERSRIELSMEREKLKLLRDFVDEASHDLKSPLASINMKLYLLTRITNPAEQAEHIREMKSLTGRMTKMIDDLLTLARLENIEEQNSSHFAINQLLNEVCEQFAALAREKQIVFDMQLPPVDLPIVASREDISRALMNLIDNAIRYTPVGGTIVVSSMTNGPEITIQVRDTGIGIAAEDVPYLFQRFFRATNARAEDPSGTGLGLPIVKKIAEKHHGRIEVHSELGKGSTFALYLPYQARYVDRLPV
jgi:PAS domain S-box-containing protein